MIFSEMIEVVNEEFFLIRRTRDGVWVEACLFEDE